MTDTLVIEWGGWQWTFGFVTGLAVAGAMNVLGTLPADPEWWYLPSLAVCVVITATIAGAKSAGDADD
ncbi:hypothetical protein [Natronoarchaeum rubrum]|uniref:hypothetical protein n=1 Tax=Natronoarchaeum rubrum TaxID=755311 RepID=UPI0021122367|nr:hypothetical protein [Natronoarchaeum rubrum]